MNQARKRENKGIRSAKELARTAVFVAAVIGAQYVLSAVPFVEIVTLLFACYAFVFGGVRGVIAAVAFAFLRQLIFGFYPVVLILYLIHFSFLSLVFGWLGKAGSLTGKRLLMVAVITAAVATVCFTLLDSLLTPIYYAYSKKATAMYFTASLPFMAGQTICAAISVAFLFFPITKAMRLFKKK